jgi:hypothetical protein
MANVYGVDHSEILTMLFESDAQSKAIRWARRYIRYGDFGGYAAITVIDEGDCVWEREAMDEHEMRQEMFERDGG